MADRGLVTGIIAVNREACPNSEEYFDYSQLCKERGIEFIEVTSYSLNNEIDKEKLLSIDVDLAITSSWQRLIPGWFIKHCRYGVIGGHGSPTGISEGRGRSPQNWALIAGKKDFSLSIFWIEEGIDDGSVIDTMTYEYDLSDDIVTSYDKTCLCMAEMIIRNLESGKIERHEGVPQSDRVAYFPKRTKEDGWIDWSRKGKEIYDFVRALTLPYPCAYTMVDDKIIRIIECKYITIEGNILDSYRCGEVVLAPEWGNVWVKCRDGIVEIRKISNPEEIVICEGLVFSSGDFYAQIQGIVERHKREIGLPVSHMILDMMGEEQT
ncbi:MAG: hypothetical protein IJT96_09190 [Lachnospiraceae bacterium]|nr:hypothetical protein [Lachnospiraceae bacterium]